MQAGHHHKEEFAVCWFRCRGTSLAIANTLIHTCNLNGVEPLAWLTDVLLRIVSGQTKNHELHTLLPWNWRQPSTIAAT
jgi:transposase